MDGSLKNSPQSFYDIIDDVSDYFADYFNQRTKSNLLSRDDLKNEGYLAGLAGIDKFDPTKAEFKTYVNTIIRYRLYDYIAENMGTLRFRRKQFRSAIAVHNLKLENKTNREIATELQLEESEVFLLQNLLNALSMQDEFLSWRDDSYSAIALIDIYDILRSNGYETAMFQMYMDNHTLKDIAAAFECSTATVNKRIKEMLILVENYIND